MYAPIVAHCVCPQITVLSAKSSTITFALDQSRLSYDTVLVQQQYELPSMRLPIVLDTCGMSALMLAHVIRNLDAGHMPGWKAGVPIPVIADVSPTAYAHHRLLACSSSVMMVMTIPAHIEALSIYVRRFGEAPPDAHNRTIWLRGLTPPLSAPCPELLALLVALDGKAKLQDVAAACHMSKATFFRRLNAICDALSLARPSAGHAADKWLGTLLDALSSPV